MWPESRDRIGHMLEYADLAAEFLGGRDAKALEADRMRFLALTRIMEIFGEAANNVAVPARAHLNDVPWRRIIEMRHRLAHGYADIDAGLLIDVIVNHLPSVTASLKAAYKDME